MATEHGSILSVRQPLAGLARRTATAAAWDTPLRDLFTGRPLDEVPATRHADDRFPPSVPLYLGPKDQDGRGRLSAWWHPAAVSADAPPAGVAVLLCSALGREELCSYTTLRHVALQLAQAGVAALRFDYAGCGDSGGDDDHHPPALDDWLRSIHTAADALRELSGVRQLVFLGLRAGALLAQQAAQARSDVLGLLAWMPVLNGRTYVRELRMLGAGSHGVAADTDELFEAGGFIMSHPTREALQDMDVRSCPSPSVPCWLVLERDDLVDPQGLPDWVEHLRRQGAQVAHERLPGYAAMMLDPHHSQVPLDWCEASLEWVLRLSARRQQVREPFHLQGAFQGSIAVVAASAARSAPVLDHTMVSAGVREQTVRLPAGVAQLYGVLSDPVQPDDGATARRPVLLINAGATRRIGPGRLYVLIARKLAQQGHTVLRLDLSGLGDSPAIPGEAAQQVYPVQAVEQLRAAVAFLHQYSRGLPVELMGLCAGAYHAQQTAHACAQAGMRLGQDVSGVLAINPLVFGESVQAAPADGLSAHQAAGEMARYRAGLWSWPRWRRLLCGEVNLLNPLKVVWRQALARGRAGAREFFRRIGRPLAGDVGEQLAQIADAGIQMGFMFSENDPGIALLSSEAGSRLVALQRAGQLSVFHIAGADHTFTRQVWREAAVQQILRWVQRAG